MTKCAHCNVRLKPGDRKRLEASGLVGAYEVDRTPIWVCANAQQCSRRMGKQRKAREALTPVTPNPARVKLCQLAALGLSKVMDDLRKAGNIAALGELSADKAQTLFLIREQVVALRLLVKQVGMK